MCFPGGHKKGQAQLQLDSCFILHFTINIAHIGSAVLHFFTQQRKTGDWLIDYSHKYICTELNL